MSTGAQSDTGLTQVELAGRLGVSVRTVIDWRSRGCPSTGGGRPGLPYQFDLAEVEAWRAQQKNLRAGAKAQVESEEQAAGLAFLNLEADEAVELELTAKARKEWAEAEIKRMQAALQRGDLVRVSRVRPLFEDLMIAVRNSFCTLSDYAEREFGLPARDVDKLQKRADATLKELRRRIEEDNLGEPEPEGDGEPVQIKARA